MMKIQLHDNGKHLEFAPLSFTRPVGDLRIGIFTNAERWKMHFPEAQISFESEDYLHSHFSDDIGDYIVNATIIPNQDLIDAMLKLKPNEELHNTQGWLVRRGTGDVLVKYKGENPIQLKKRWHLFQKNAEVLESDFALVTKGRTSVQLSSTNTILGDPAKIFVEEGAVVEACILNTNPGPIYIGKNAEIMEGAIIRGGLALCESSTIKMGAKIYGSTTVGPHCKVGGEISNCIFQSYSNKGHDGFLGNSLIGEWCNLGADTNTSNLKNNYGLVRSHSFITNTEEETDQQFIGLTMGDHSKSGINTMFNTATVVGVSSNVYGAEFPPKYIPSFKWGIHGSDYTFIKAIESANNMMSRRGLQLSQGEIDILQHIADKK